MFVCLQAHARVCVLVFKWVKCWGLCIVCSSGWLAGSHPPSNLFTQRGLCSWLCAACEESRLHRWIAWVMYVFVFVSMPLSVCAHMF